MKTFRKSIRSFIASEIASLTACLDPVAAYEASKVMVGTDVDGEPEPLIETTVFERDPGFVPSDSQREAHRFHDSFEEDEADVVALPLVSHADAYTEISGTLDLSLAPQRKAFRAA